MKTQTRTGGDAWSFAIHETRASWREMLDRRAVLPNVAAGITTALVALPLNVALALACGLPPAVGLITGVVAGVISALLGGSRSQVTGPEVALAPLTFVIASEHGIAGLLVATFLAGLLQIALGLLRVGRLVYAVPAPVIGGFMAAVGLLVLDTQLPRLLGLEGVRALSAPGGVASLARVALPTLAIGAGAIAALLILPRLHRRIPAPLVAMGIGVLAVAAGVPAATLAPIEVAAPPLGLPAFGAVDLVAIAPKAAALALLASLDSLLCALAMDTRVGGARTRTDQELIAQGMANIASACVGGMPVAAAVVRSVAAHEAGATTRLAPLTQSVMLGLILIVFAPFTSLVPVAALSGILLVVGFRLIDWRGLVRTFRAARFEAAIFVVTAVAILVRDFVTGVAVGVVLATLDFARRNARLAVYAQAARRVRIDGRRRDVRGSAGARVVRLDGPLFFGSHTQVEHLLAEASGTPRLVIDLSGVPDADLTGASSLARVVARLASEGTEVRLRGVSAGLRPLLSEAQALADRTRPDAPPGALDAPAADRTAAGTAGPAVRGCTGGIDHYESRARRSRHMTNTFEGTMHGRREATAEREASDTRRVGRRHGSLRRRGEGLGGVAVLALALAAWHFLPLPHRVELTNTTASPMRGLVLRLGSEELAAGDLSPGQSFAHTFFQRRRPGAAPEASALIDGHRRSLGRCGNGVLSAAHTRISLRGTTIDDLRDCRSEPPRIGHLP